ncbi:MAG TPA: hypothetical protein VGJ16_09065, partial [Pirellulales bacterium]
RPRNLTAPSVVIEMNECGFCGHRKMAPDDLFLSDEDFRYAAECRRLARLARPTRLARPKRATARRIDVARYMRALEALGQLWRGVADRSQVRSMPVRR